MYNIYKNFANNIDNEIEIEKGNDWQCDTEEKIIYIPLIESQEECEKFINNFKKQWQQKNKKIKLFFAPQIISFLHEIGHTQTKQGDIISKALRKISNFLCKHKATKKLSYKIYYNIPEEKRATQWAIEFIMNNYNNIVLFNSELENKYFEMYEKILKEN